MDIDIKDEIYISREEIHDYIHQLKCAEVFVTKSNTFCFVCSICNCSGVLNIPVESEPENFENFEKFQEHYHQQHTDMTKRKPENFIDADADNLAKLITPTSTRSQRLSKKKINDTKELKASKYQKLSTTPKIKDSIINNNRNESSTSLDEEISTNILSTIKSENEENHIVSKKTKILKRISSLEEKIETVIDQNSQIFTLLTNYLGIGNNFLTDDFEIPMFPVATVEEIRRFNEQLGNADFLNQMIIRFKDDSGLICIGNAKKTAAKILLRIASLDAYQEFSWSGKGSIGVNAEVTKLAFSAMTGIIQLVHSIAEQSFKYNEISMGIKTFMKRVPQNIKRKSLTTVVANSNS